MNATQNLHEKQLDAAAHYLHEKQQQHKTG
jgi:hypothetical protein